MKKIISFMLALVMIASMAVVAFAEGETATEPTTETIYDAADFGTHQDVVETPDAVKGKKGFGGLAVKLDLTLAAGSDAQGTLWDFTDFDADDSYVVYYYVAENTGAQLMMYERPMAFPSLGANSVGYHAASFTPGQAVDCLSLYVKNENAYAVEVEVYIGSIVVVDGAYTAPSVDVIRGEDIAQWYEDASKPNPYPHLGSSDVVDTPAEVKEALGDKVGDKALKVGSGKAAVLAGIYKFKKGTMYRITLNVYLDTPSDVQAGLRAFFNGGLNSEAYLGGIVPGKTGAMELTCTYYRTDADSWNFFVNYGGTISGYIGDIEVEVLGDDWTVTMDAYDLAAGSSSNTITEEGLLFTDFSGWGPSLTNVFGRYQDYHLCSVGNLDVSITYTFNALDGGNFHFRDSFDGSLIDFPDELGRHTYSFVGDVQSLTQIHAGAGSMAIESITISPTNVTAPTVKATISAADFLSPATKNAELGSEEIACDLVADKVYMLNINCFAYIGGAAPTVTVGNKVITLAAGDNNLEISVLGGADKIVFNAPSATVLVGDITYEEVGEDYADFMSALNTYVATLKMDKTLATTVEAAAEYVTGLVEASGDYTVKSITYVADSFVPYADDATVAAASAATNGSISFVIDIEETDARGFTFSDTFTFEIVKKDVISDYNAVVATGDSAIVAIVALIAVISLAGVVIAKKKVASK